MTRPALALVLLAACGASPPAPPAAPARGAGDAHQHRHHGNVAHDFSDAARWSRLFDDPARDAWQKPDEVVRLLAIESGMTVVDLGAGTGYFGERLAAAAGPSGRVLALDPEPHMVDFMRERFRRAGVAGIEARVCPTDATGLGPSSVQRVLVVDTWHHIEHRDRYARHLGSVLAPGGFVLVVDFTLESDKGPPKQHRLAPDQVLAELRAGGLETSVLAETLPDQYVVQGKKPGP